MINGFVSTSIRAVATPVSTQALEFLAQRLLTDAIHAKAPGTIKTYSAPWRAYREWVQQVLPGLESAYDVPAETVAMYLTSVRLGAAGRGVGPAAVLTASAAIHCYHELAGKCSPTDHPACQLVRETARRTLAATITKLSRDPLEAGDVRQLVQVYCHPAASLMDRMHTTVICIMVLGLLRYDDVAKILVHEDLLIFDPDGRFVEFFLYKSKTDQHMEGHWVTLSALSHSTCCPVKLLQALLAAGNYQRTASAGVDVGPLLRAVRCHGKGHVLQKVTAPLSDPIPSLGPDRLRNRLQDLCSSLGIDKDLGNHSARIGGTTSAAALQVPDRLFQQAGHWRSTQCRDRYVRESLEQRLAVSRSLGV